MSSSKISVAVVTGRHPFDVPNFHALFESIPDISYYIMNLEDFVFHDFSKHPFDAAVFYNMHQEIPNPDGGLFENVTYNKLLKLGESEMGIFVLHHGILAYPEWQLWSDIVGIQNRRFGFHNDQHFNVQITNPDHPITSGLKAWEMEDETYTMNDVGEDSNVLLSVDHEKSMKHIAWTRSYKNARVFCFQSGHNNTTFSEPNYRQVIAQGIRWVAKRI